MLEPLLGSKSRESVLVFIHARNEGYAREIARFFHTDLGQIQKQLNRLELAGILVSHQAGRTRLYIFNPSYPLLDELAALLDRALQHYSLEQRYELLMNRRKSRPREQPL